MFKFSAKSLERLAGVDPDLVRVAHRALQLTRIDFGIPEHGGLRTPEEQHRLYLDGKSNADGYQSKSYHQSGNALDFYAYVEGKASWQPEHLAQVACAFLQAAGELGVNLEWGGLWKSFRDMPHVQITEVRHEH